jgi:predicted Na+-dependent transporter
MLLVLATIIVVPLAAPRLVSGLTVDAGGMAWTLVRQLLLPMVAGALLAHFLPGLNKSMQPNACSLGWLGSPTSRST